MLKLHELYLLELIQKVFGCNNSNLPILNEQETKDLVTLADVQGVSRYLINYIPYPYIIKIKTKFRINKKRCKNMFALANDFFNSLSSYHVPYALIKGIYLSYCAYQTPYHRLSQDIDILIPPSQKNIVAKILTDSGYVQGHLNSKGELVKYTHKEKVFYSMNTHQMAPFVKMEDNKISSIDINFNITWGENRDEKINLDEFCTDTNEYIFNQTSLQVLSVEKCLIQYCLHLYKDMNSIVLLSANQGFKLSNFCDVYSIIKYNKNFDIDLFVKMLCNYEIIEYVYKVFYYTSLIFQDESILVPFQKYVYKSQIINTFGLADDEISVWPVPFFEYLFSENRFEIIKPYLNEKQIQKIYINKIFL